MAISDVYRPRRREEFGTLELCVVGGCVILVLGAGVVFFALGNSWLQILLAAPRLLFTQVAFLAPDVGHGKCSTQNARHRWPGCYSATWGSV